MHARIDKERDETEERKQMHARINKDRNKSEKRKQLFSDREKTPKRKARDQTEERIHMHKIIDNKRDKTQKRRSMHNKIDKKRDQTPKRKKMHADYEKTDTRKYFVKRRDESNYQKKLMASLKTDTGFDEICSSCLQYKSKNYCKLISILRKKRLRSLL